LSTNIASPLSPRNASRRTVGTAGPGFRPFRSRSVGAAWPPLRARCRLRASVAAAPRAPRTFDLNVCSDIAGLPSIHPTSRHRLSRTPVQVGFSHQ
jgi:hypothetical protein